jgi:putative inorganic carbon (hco3(-)) transporter
VALGVIAITLLLNDPDILNRFSTVFVSAEERDGSAAGRLQIWQAAVKMIADHPLGMGGTGFGTYSRRYLTEVDIDRGRAAHNGYINEAVEWGVQGLLLRLLLLASAIALGWRTLRAQKDSSNGDAVILGACLLTSMTAYLGTAMFGDYMEEEWGYWIVALLVIYSRLYASHVQPAPSSARQVDGVFTANGQAAAGRPSRAAASAVP